MIYDSDRRPQPRYSWELTREGHPEDGDLCWISYPFAGEGDKGMRVDSKVWRYRAETATQLGAFVAIEYYECTMRLKAVDYYCVIPTPVIPAIEITMPRAMAAEFSEMSADGKNSALYWLKSVLTYDHLADLFVDFCNGHQGVRLGQAVVTNARKEHRAIQEEVLEAVAVIVAGMATLNTGTDGGTNGRNDFGIQLVKDLFTGVTGDARDWLEAIVEDLRLKIIKTEHRL